jgi:hypothetical protein
MKKIVFVFLLIFVGFTPNLISASNVNANRANIKTKIVEKIEAREAKLLQIQDKFQNKIQIKTASREAKLSHIKQSLIRKYYQQMSTRLWATVERLETLVSRIEARITIVDAETDKDLTSITSDVEKAKSLLNDTKVLLTSSDSMIDSVLNSNSPKDAFTILKSNITDVKTNLREVHKLLVKVIGNVSGLHLGNIKLTPTVTIKAV